MSKFFIILIIAFLFLIIFCDFESYENYNVEKALYKILLLDFNNIFNDGNRNAGGAQFYHHIVTNLDPSKKEYEIYNQLYCSVSGSPIDYDRDDKYDEIVMDDLDGNKIYGKYYRCCWPCICDIMKYGKVENHTVSLKDETFNQYVLTIEDPCKNEDKIPKKVTSFKCENSETKNAIKTNSGRIIIGILHDAIEYDPNKHNIDRILKKCEKRMNTEPDDLKSGMGDIFVKLSLVNS